MYFDHICVSSKTKKEHIKDIKYVLRELKEEKLGIELRKCSFHQKKIKFLK